MRRVLSAFFLAFLIGALAQSTVPSEAEFQHARKLLAEAMLIDGHHGLPWTIRRSIRRESNR